MSPERYYDHAYDITDSDEARDYYRRWAATYDEELTELDYALPGRAADALRELLPDVDARILDVGCGTGMSGRALAERGYRHLEGADFSPEMLAEAARRGDYRELHQIDLNRPLARFGDHTYDAVTAVGCFSFGHVDVRALDELHRITRPGGVLLIAVNEPYYDEGTLVAKLDELTSDGRLEIVVQQLGDHIPSHDVSGWVIAGVCRGAGQPARGGS